MAHRVIRPADYLGVALLFVLSTQIEFLVARQDTSSISPPRFQSAIDQFLKADSVHAPSKGGILFVGSSIFRRWTKVEQQMSPLPVFNRAFGGSRTSEILYYMDRIVLPYEPRVIVYYCGSNDINAGDRPDSIADRFRQFCQRVHAKLPDTRILFVSIQCAPQKQDRWNVVDSSNSLIDQYCAGTRNVEFVDVNHILFDSGGDIRPELFLPDMLHLTDQAYIELGLILRPIIESAWKRH